MGRERRVRSALGIFVFYGKDTVFWQIVDAFYDKIQNAAYSYSGSWLLAGQDEEEDAAFVKPAHAEEALPGSDSFCRGLTGRISVDCRTFVNISSRAFFTPFFIEKSAFKTPFFQYETAVCFESPSTGYDAVVKQLLEKDAAVDSKDSTYGWTSMFWAVMGRYDALVTR